MLPATGFQVSSFLTRRTYSKRDFSGSTGSLPDSRYLTGIRAKASSDRQAQVVTNRKSSILGRFSTRTNTRCPKAFAFHLALQRLDVREHWRHTCFIDTYS